MARIIVPEEVQLNYDWCKEKGIEDNVFIVESKSPNHYRAVEIKNTLEHNDIKFHFETYDE